jgi:hypothetical protein
MGPSKASSPPAEDAHRVAKPKEWNDSPPCRRSCTYYRRMLDLQAIINIASEMYDSTPAPPSFTFDPKRFKQVDVDMCESVVKREKALRVITSTRKEMEALTAEALKEERESSPQ